MAWEKASQCEGSRQRDNVSRDTALAAGKSALESKDYGQAAEKFREALKYDEQLIDAWVGLNQALENQGNRRAAVTALARAEALAQSDDPVITARLGVRLAEMGHLGVASQMLERVLGDGAPELDMPLAEQGALFQLWGDLLMTQGDPAQAQAAFKRAVSIYGLQQLKPALVRALISEAEAALQMHNKTAAEGIFMRLRSIEIDDVEADFPQLLDVLQVRAYRLANELTAAQTTIRGVSAPTGVLSGPWHLEVGRVLNARGDTDGAHDAFVTALQSGQDHGPQSVALEASYELGRLLWSHDPRKAREFHQSAWHFAHDLGARQWMGLLTAELMEMNIRLGDWDQATDVQAQGYAALQGERFPRMRVEHWTAQGEVAFRFGHNPLASELFAEALRLADPQRDAATIPMIELRQGQIACKLRRWDHAFNKLRSARVGFERLKNQDRMHHADQEVAGVYYMRATDPQATEREMDLSRALELVRRCSDFYLHRYNGPDKVLRQAQLADLWGSIALTQGDYDQSLRLLGEANRRHIARGDAIGSMKVLYKFSLCQLRLGDIDGAGDTLLQMQVWLEDNAHRLAQTDELIIPAEYHRQRARYHEARGQFSQAIQSYRWAGEIFQRMGNLSGLEQTFGRAIQLADAMGDQALVQVITGQRDNAKGSV